MWDYGQRHFRRRMAVYLLITLCPPDFLLLLKHQRSTHRLRNITLLHDRIQHAALRKWWGTGRAARPFYTSSMWRRRVRRRSGVSDLFTAC